MERERERVGKIFACMHIENVIHSQFNNREGVGGCFPIKIWCLYYCIILVYQNSNSYSIIHCYIHCSCIQCSRGWQMTHSLSSSGYCCQQICSPRRLAAWTVGGSDHRVEYRVPRRYSSVVPWSNLQKIIKSDFLCTHKVIKRSS